MAAVVAEVSRRTGVPVVIHSNPANGNGLELVRLVTREGVPADQSDADVPHRATLPQRLRRAA